jgi:hypothetical protein
MGVGGKVFHVCKHIDQMPSPTKVMFPTTMVGHLWTKQNGMDIHIMSSNGGGTSFVTKLFSSIPNLKGSVLANPTNMVTPPIDPTLQTTLAPIS